MTDDMTDDEPGALTGNEAVLAGATPGKLPYPESADPANQGANAIKALALALDGRVGAYCIRMTTAYPTTDASGNFTIPINPALPAVPAGFIYSYQQGPTSFMALFQSSTVSSITLKLYSTTDGSLRPNTGPFRSAVLVWCVAPS